MAFCPKCGSQVTEGTKFCAACGAAIDPAPLPTPAAIIPPAPPLSQGGLTPNVAAMLCYLPLCLIGLICAILFGFVIDPYKRNSFVRFHAWQSLSLHVAFIVFWVCWTIFSMILTAMMHFFVFLTFPVSMIVGLGALVLMVFLMVKAYSNERFKVPGIGPWAEKQAGV